MSSWSYPALEVAVEERLATLTLSDPENLNAIRVGTFAGLTEALDEITKPKHGVRAVLLRGEGRAFCSGLNLKEDRSARPAAGLAQGLVNPLMRRLRALEIPVVAAVQGPCVGIGVALALAAVGVPLITPVPVLSDSPAGSAGETE